METPFPSKLREFHYFFPTHHHLHLWYAMEALGFIPILTFKQTYKFRLSLSSTHRKHWCYKSVHVCVSYFDSNHCQNTMSMSMAKFILNEGINVFLFTLPVCAFIVEKKKHFAAKINHILHVDAKVTNDKFIQRTRTEKGKKLLCILERRQWL